MIRTLQRKLYPKAKQEPAYRFYALYDKAWRADTLMFAYRLVRANKGSSGVDGINFEDIEQKTGIDTFLLEPAQDLKDKTYHPSPVRRVMIPKADGSQCPLGIPTIRDRVAQMAVKLINETKTRIVDARQMRFNFLGFAIGVSKSWQTGRSFTHICPAPKSFATIKERITRLTARERTPIPLEDIVGSMNATLRGHKR